MQIPHQKHLEAATTLIGRNREHAKPFLQRLRDRPCSHTFWGNANEAVILVTEGAGSVATFMTSPLTKENKSQLLQALKVAKTNTAQKGVATAHALLGVFDKPLRQLFESAGFATLATLQYMEWHARQSSPAIAQTTNATFATIATRSHDELCSTLEKTFIGSLDCPAIHGKRHVDDILASHQGFEQNNLSLWFTILAENKPAGVLLMNRLPNEDVLELAYLGILPEMRRRGLAKDALTHAVNQAVKRGCDKIILAVDIANTPAISLYKKVHFLETANRMAMFCLLH